MSLASRKAAIDATFNPSTAYGESMSTRVHDILTSALPLDIPAPAAKTADATLTIAELLAGLVTVTSASAVALTLPTGTLADAGVLAGALLADQGISWSVINLGSVTGDVTMTAGATHTYVGAAVVAIGTSARFLTRKTAANTFVTYRVA